MGFNSGFKVLMNVLYVYKQEFCASSWTSNQGYSKMHVQPTIKFQTNVVEKIKTHDMFNNPV